MRLRPLALAILIDLFGMFLVACGDEDSSSDDPIEEPAPATETPGLDPAAVEESVREFLMADEVVSPLSPSVDCGDEAAETIECSVSGSKGLQGSVTAQPSQGFAYTGEVEDQDGLSSLGGSSDTGSITDPASVEESLNETLSDDAGTPTADCPDAPEGDSLECEISGDDVTGTLTATPIGGFEWEGQVETPDGTRGIAGNELP